MGRIMNELNYAYADKLVTFLTSNGIRFNADLEIMINGQRIPNSQFPTIVKCLLNRVKGSVEDTPGLKEICSILRTLNLDDSGISKFWKQQLRDPNHPYLTRVKNLVWDKFSI